MSQLQTSILIAAGKEEVFAVFADLESAQERIEDIIQIEMLTEGPMALGTRWRETRKVFGKEATEEMEITVFDVPNKYAAEAESHGSQYFSEYVFEQEGEETRVTMTFRAKPLTFFAKIMAFITGPMIKKTLLKCIAKDLNELKQHIEGRPAEATAS
jgi:hypothetical protein